MTKIKGRRIAGAGLALMMIATGARGQAAQEPKPMTRAERQELRDAAPLTTFWLKNCGLSNDGNEILTALRLMLDPAVKLYLVPKDNTILLKALPDEVATASKLIEELDRPHKTYRLTYAVTEFDGSKRLGTKHFVLVLVDGQRGTFKSGEKVPVATGIYSWDKAATETQMTYLDVGWNFDSTLNATLAGAQLKVKAERSSVAEAKAPAATPDPSINQSILESVTTLSLGKAVMVGSMEVPESTQHVEIEATVELVP